jgi:hypothetical protein
MLIIAKKYNGYLAKNAERFELFYFCVEDGC